MQSSETEKQFNQVLRRNVKDYFIENNLEQKGGATVFLKAFAIIGMLVLSYTLMLLYGSQSRILFFIFFLSTVFFQLMTSFAVMHDASHYAFSKVRWINIFVTHLLLSLGGVSAATWMHKHVVSHHMHTNVSEKDADIDGAPFFVFNRYQKRRSYHRFQHLYTLFFYAFLTGKWILYDDFRDLAMNVYKLKRKQWWACFWDILISRLIYLTVSIILPVIFYGSFAKVIIFWCVYNALFSIGLTLVFQCAHVNTKTEFYNVDMDKKLNFSTHQIRSTVDYATHNSALTLYLGGLNFQVIHHLFPSINHAHYPAIQKILIDTLQEYPSITYNKYETFSEAISDHLLYLKQIGNAQYGS